MITLSVSQHANETWVAVRRWVPGARYPEQMSKFTLTEVDRRDPGRVALREAAIAVLVWLEELHPEDDA